MGIALIKKLNEKTPYWVKAPFAKFIRGKLIKNKVFIEQYELLKKSDMLSDEEKETWKKRELESLLRFAFENSTYYKGLMEDSCVNPLKDDAYKVLAALPVLTKEILKKNREIIAVSCIDNYYEVSTGGSTGEPTRLYMENDAIYKEWAFVYHYWSKFGYDYRRSKLATFRGVQLGNRISEINPLYQEIRLNPFILNYENFEKYCKRIEAYGADFIYGYPSAVYNFCRISEKLGIDIAGKFKAAFLISENLYDFQRELIEKKLKCPIAHFFGHSERAVFGEDYGSGYSFNPFYGHTEISNGGEPIVTGFINRKTPLIRYLVDDNVQINSNGLYDIVGHRSCDVLYGLQGEQVSMAAINFHDDTFDGVTAYQFVQNELAKCVVRVVPEQQLSDKELHRIRVRVQEKLGKGFQVYAEIVDAIPLTSRGKYQLLVQNIKQ